MLGRIAVALSCLGLAALSAAGCGGAHRSAAPFAKDDSTEAGGYPVLASAPSGVTLRFLPGQPLGIGIVLHNRSPRPVTLVDARAVEPARTLVHQIGATLLPWNPPACTGNHSCPLVAFLREPFAAAAPRPVTVGGGKGVAVQLDFRLGACSAVPFATAAAPTQVELLFRHGSGALERQVVRLGDSRLRLRMPVPSDCARRPHSRIAVDGPFATSSDWTIPGSTGDACTVSAAGVLSFRSRLYAAPGGPMVRVELRLPSYHGRGTYATGRASVVVGIGPHGWETFPARTTFATVVHVARDDTGGRFHATIAAPRRAAFRVYGAWRCILR
jgi:hypothetical protein